MCVGTGSTAIGIGDSIVFLRVQQIKTRHRRISQIELAIRHIKRFQLTAREVGKQFGPEQFAFANDDTGAMFLGLFAQRRNRDAAHDDGNIFRAVIIRHVARLVKLRGERADGDQIKIYWQLRQIFKVGDFVILDVEFFRRQAGEREQAEARQRGDDFVTIYEAGQREPERGEFRVVRADAAHGDEADAFFHVHNFTISNKVKTPPVIRLTTGTEKIRCAFGKCAITTQQTGIAIAPVMKASEAI